MEAKGYILHFARHRYIVDREHDFIGNRLAIIGPVIAVSQLPPHHKALQLAGARLAALHRVDEPAIAQNGDAIGMLDHFVEVMRNENDRVAAAFDAVHYREKLFLAQTGSRPSSFRRRPRSWD